MLRPRCCCTCCYYFLALLVFSPCSVTRNLHESGFLFNGAVVALVVAGRCRGALLGFVRDQARGHLVPSAESDRRARRIFLAGRLPTTLHGRGPILHPRFEPFLGDVRRWADRHPSDSLLAPGHVPVVRLDAEVAIARGAHTLLVGPRWRARCDRCAALLLHGRVHLKRKRKKIKRNRMLKELKL